MPAPQQSASRSPYRNAQSPRPAPARSGQERAEPPRAIDFWDAIALYNASNSLTGFAGKGPQYQGLFEVCAQVRRENSFPPAEQIQLLTASDPSKEAQVSWRGHVTRIDPRITNIDIPFWESAVTLPPLRPDDEKPARTVYSFGALIAYQLGVMASRRDLSVVIASNAFEIAAPAADLVQRTNASVVIAFWRSMLDPRWERSGYLLHSDAPLRFFDLEPVSQAILGVEVGRGAAERGNPGPRRRLPV